MKIVTNFILFFFFSLTVFAQNSISLSGKIIDSADSSAIYAASLDLLALPDSLYAAGDNSGEDGRFTLRNLSAGRYVLKVSCIGYQTIYKNVTLADSRTRHDLGSIPLTIDAIALRETVIEGKKPEVVVRNDTIEYDAASVKTTENAVVEDLLKKLPGVEVADDGKITVNGKEVKKFLVEGKEFFSDDPQIASKNLPAEMVDKLQVVDRKSDMARMTGFDDGDEETVINLTVRAGMKKGTMGNFLAGAGKDLNITDDIRYQAGAFVNNMTNNDRYTLILQANNNNNMGAADLGANQFGDMRMRRGAMGGITKSINPMLNFSKEFSKTLTLTADFRYNNRNQNVDNQTEQVSYSTVVSRHDFTNTQTNYYSDNIGTNMMLEWKPDTNNTLIFRPNLYYNKSHSDETEFATQTNFNSGDTISDSRGTVLTKGSGIGFGGQLDYSHRFAKPGRVFSINARGRYNDSWSTENDASTTRRFLDGTYNYDALIDQQTENDNHSSNIRATVSMVEPVGNNNFIQALYRVTYNSSENLNTTYALDPTHTQAIIADSLSRSTERNSTEHRFGLNFKAVRTKYNYTIGINYDPSSSLNNTWQPLRRLTYAYDEAARLENLMGDSLVSSITQKVNNFSPVGVFNYIFDQRSNLRINYEGETSQPSATQLRDYVDKSRPYNWTEGNPNLKPGYRNELRVQFRKYVPETQLQYNLNFFGDYSVNEIAEVTTMLGDSVRLTSYDNINGNWNANLFGMFSIPLKNKKFSVRNMLGPRYSNRNTFVDKLENTQRTFAFMDNAGIDYRSSLFDMGASLTVNYSNITHTIQPQNNKETVSYGIGGTTVWYLPANITIESQINYTKRQGYDSYNISETMWNAAATKQLFSKKIGTGLLKLQIFDILKNRSSIWSQATSNGYQITSANVIPSYFMASFIYKFTSFPKSSGGEEEFRNDGRRWSGDGPPPGGGRPGGFSGGGRPF